MNKKYLAKEIAAELQVSKSYISKARKAGLPIITTPAEALQWIKEHKFKTSQSRKKIL